MIHLESRQKGHLIRPAEHTFIEDFVANVPTIDLALPLACRLYDVVLDDARERGRVADGGDPAWQLGVPDEGVATNVHAVGLCIVDKGISAGKVEVVLAGFNGIPLHAVLRRKLVELRLDDGNILRVGEKTGVRASTEILFALGHDAASQTVGGGICDHRRRG